MYQKRKAMENFLILIVDIFTIWVSSGIAFGLRYGMLYGRDNHIDQLWQITLISLLYGLMTFLTDYNRHFFRRGYFEETVAIVRNQVVFSITWVVILFLINRSGDLSRLVFGYFSVINIFAMLIFRTVFKQFMIKIYKTSKYSSRLLLVTTSKQIDSILENLIGYNEWNRILVGVVLTDQSQIEIGRAHV